MGDARDVQDWVRRNLVDDLAGGRLYRFDRRSIESAVDGLLEHDAGRHLAAEIADQQNRARVTREQVPA